MHTHTHVSSPTLEVCGWEGEWVGREEEVSCPYLDLHLDLQVSPVDGEQCAVRAGGAQLPGAVGHVPVAVSQEDQRGEGGDLAGEGVLFCRRGEGYCTSSEHSLTHTVNGVHLCFIYTAPLYFMEHKYPISIPLTHVDVHAAPRPTHPC